LNKCSHQTGELPTILAYACKIKNIISKMQNNTFQVRALSP